MNIILNVLLYVLLTGGIILYFVKDKYINEKIEKLMSPIFNKIYKRFNIRKKSTKKTIESTFDWVQTILVALILVFLIQVFYLGNYTVPTSSMYPTIKPGERFFADKVSYKFREPDRGEIIVFKEPLYNKNRYTKRLIGLPGDKVSIKNGDVYINGDIKKMNHDFTYYNMGFLGDNTWQVPREGDEIKFISGTIRHANKFYTVDEFQNLLKKDRSVINDIYIEDPLLVLNNDITTGPIYDRDILYKLLMGEEVKLDTNYYFALGDNSGNSLDSRYWGFVAEDRLLGRMLVRFWPVTRMGRVK